MNASAHATRRRAHGFTLIEALIAVGIAGVLSSIAYPRLEGPVLRARRTDALVTLMQAQLAQERYRADHRSYGSLAETGMPATSASGYYAVAVVSTSEDGYDLLASASARQARDTHCRFLRLSSVGARLVYASGRDDATSNGDDANRKCWSR